jgi:tRNA pseudouridine55 synthase
MDGIIILDKPAGISSARAVDRVKKLLPRGVRIGHAGTLDPFATGVLLLLVGRATRACERLMAEPKTYEATIKLGSTTATDDPESAEIPWPRAQPAAKPSRDHIAAALKQFTGTIQQRPPAFSALKVAGQRAYKLARAGKPPDLQPRPVQIHRIELLSYDWPLLQLRIECGRGTYIRALARDIGESLHTGGYLTALRRTRIGPFTLANAVSMEKLAAEGIAPHLTPLPAAVPLAST